MKECDILGGQNILWPLLPIFRRSGPPTPMIYALDLWIMKQVCAAAATTCRLRLQIAIAMYSRSNCVTNNYAVVMFVCDHRFWIEGNLVRQPVTELTNWKVLMSSDLVQITLNVTCNFVSNLKFEYLSNEQGRSQRGGQGGQSHPNPS